MGVMYQFVLLTVDYENGTSHFLDQIYVTKALCDQLGEQPAHEVSGQLLDGLEGGHQYKGAHGSVAGQPAGGGGADGAAD